MHPEFWLVLLRVLRVPLTALLGTLPVTLVVVGIFAKLPSGISARLFAIAGSTLMFGLLAMPVLALERVPERWTDSRLVRLGRLAYLLGGVAPAAVLLMTVFDSASGGPVDVVARLRSAARDAGFFVAIFHLYVGAPLIADQLNHRLTRRPLVFALPCGLGAVAYLALVWTLDATFAPFGHQQLRPDGAPWLPPLLLVGGWPLGLALGRAGIERLTERIERAVDEAELSG